MIEIIMFLLGITLIVWGTERFTEGLIGSAVISGVSTFALGIVFGGFDAENLGTGIIAALRGLPGISLGTVIGSSIFLLTAAVGATAILVPLEVSVPKRYVYLTLLSPVPLFAFMLGGIISRVEGLLLFALSLVVIGYMVKDSRTHVFIKEKEEVKEVLEEREKKPRWFFPALMLFGLVVMVVGAEILVGGAIGIMGSFGISDTTLGMVFVAAAVSFEEVARMVIPAAKGRPEISMGNVLGTILFFVLFNVGIIAMIAPLRVEASAIAFHAPFMFAALFITSVFVLRKRIAHAEGVVLLIIYGLYLFLNYYV